MSGEMKAAGIPAESAHAEELASIPSSSSLPNGCECDLEKIRYQAQVDLLKTRVATDHDLEKAEADTDSVGLEWLQKDS
jgi:hypothetical protein